MRRAWLKETARDIAALGGIPFLAITVVRVAPISLAYVMQFLISSFLFFCLRAVFRGTLRAGIGLILVAFTSIFYKSGLFLAFAILLYCGMIASFLYLEETKKDVAKGALLGAVSAAAGYAAVEFFF